MFCFNTTDLDVWLTTAVQISPLLK